MVALGDLQVSIVSTGGYTTCIYNNINYKYNMCILIIVCLLKIVPISPLEKILATAASVGISIRGCLDDRLERIINSFSTTRPATT